MQTVDPALRVGDDAIVVGACPRCGYCKHMGYTFKVALFGRGSAACGRCFSLFGVCDYVEDAEGARWIFVRKLDPGQTDNNEITEEELTA